MANRRLIELFLELARIDGRSGQEAAVAQYAYNFLKKLSFDPQKDGANTVTKSNTSNIVCSVGGGGELALLAHMDTAGFTSSTRQAVTADKIASDGKRLLGVSSRAGMAAILYAVERAAVFGLPFKPFTVAFTTQGETTMAGGRNLRLPKGVRYAFVFDSPLDPGLYVTASPGVAVFAAHVTGRPAGRGADAGVSAIGIASAAIAALGAGPRDPEVFSNVGMIAGGESTGVVPVYTLVRGEARAFDKDRAKPVVEGIKAGFERAAYAAGGKAMFNWDWEFLPYRHEAGAAVCRLAEAALRGAGLQPAPAASQGGSDANSLNARGVAALDLGIGARNQRTNDEYILLDHLAQASEIAWQLIKI